jgi:prepilin peptidase CpaA
LGRRKIEITPSHITGLIAVTISIYFMIAQRHDLSIVAASIYFTLACTTDTLKHKIPNLLNLCLLIAGIVIFTLNQGMSGLLSSLCGFGLGLALLLLPHLMGGIGAGDVKALGALGALIGPYDILHVFIYMGLYGGLLAVIHYCYTVNMREMIRETWVSVCATAFIQKDKQDSSGTPKPVKASMRFPYSAAIAFGYYSFVYWGGLL